MDKPDIWMPLYIGDYLADTMHLTTEQHGAYLLLIMGYWRNGGPLPGSDQYLSAICRLGPDAWSNAKAMLKHFFDTESVPSHWVHSRIEKEMSEAGKNKQKRVVRAKKAAEARWCKDAPSNAPSNAQAMLEECPSPSPSPYKDQEHCAQQAEHPKEKIQFEKIRAIYNEVCGGLLPEAMKLDDKRIRNIRKCWNMTINGDRPFQRGEFWKQYFSDCLLDTHWKGENPRGWRADLEFLTRETSVLKVLERT